ncbi:MAG: hypothetical protein Q9162_007461 [Coniocarpon cinnabarinum]
MPSVSSSPQDESMSTPRTPQPQTSSTPDLTRPPEPPKVRIKRRRPTLMSHVISHEQLSSSYRTPSIELSVPESTGTNPPTTSAPDLPETHMLVTSETAPITPLSKLQTSMSYFSDGLKTPEPWSAHSQWSKGESITRPSSTWSELSDSSASSVSSFGTTETVGESIISPNSELLDPFTPSDVKSELMPSAIPKDVQVQGRRLKKYADAEWTLELDEHLWLSYMTYLSDPVNTPFKTLPGIAPPLGVCHRVARRAKKNWKGPRSTLSALSENSSASFASIDATLHEPSNTSADSPDTIKAPVPGRSLSAGARRHPAKWPFSNSATRKRLRELCKHKPALSPHYQRLMHSRSPSPFESSSSQTQGISSPREADSEQTAFSTRHMNTMLTTSTATSMQPGNPLSQLSSSQPRTPQRSNPHVKSSSMQSTFGVNNQQQHQEGLASLRQLASPFQEKSHNGTNASHTASNHNDEPTLRPFRSLQASRAVPPQRRQASPLEIHQPRPMTASMKRRAQYQLGEELLSDNPELRQSFLEDVFRDPATASGKRRVRSRGFSLGAVRNNSNESRQSSRQLSELFTPPSTTDPQQASSSAQAPREQPIQEHGPPKLGTPFQPHASQQMPAPTFGNDAARRLGSPFAPMSNVGMSNTFPRSLFPQGLGSIAKLDSQREQQEQARADVEMTDPFTDDQALAGAFGCLAKSNSGTIRRYRKA